MMLLLRLHAWQRSTPGFSVVSFPADLTDVHYRGNLLSVSENVVWNHKDRLSSSAVRGENKGTKMSSAALKPLSPVPVPVVVQGETLSSYWKKMFMSFSGDWLNCWIAGNVLFFFSFHGTAILPKIILHSLYEVHFKLFAASAGKHFKNESLNLKVRYFFAVDH